MFNNDSDFTIEGNLSPSPISPVFTGGAYQGQPAPPGQLASPGVPGQLGTQVIPGQGTTGGSNKMLYIGIFLVIIFFICGFLGFAIMNGWFTATVDDKGLSGGLGVCEEGEKQECKCVKIKKEKDKDEDEEDEDED